MELVSYNAWYNKTNSKHWRYVITLVNLADTALRRSFQGLGSNKLWWNGPEFLDALVKLPKPEFPEVPDPIQLMKAVNWSLYNIINAMTKTEKDLWRSDAKGFSSWNKFVRILWWVMIHKKILGCKKVRFYRILTPDEITEIKMNITKMS